MLFAALDARALSLQLHSISASMYATQPSVYSARFIYDAAMRHRFGLEYARPAAMELSGEQPHEWLTDAVWAFLGRLLADPWADHVELQGVELQDGFYDHHIYELVGLLGALAQFEQSSCGHVVCAASEESAALSSDHRPPCRCQEVYIFLDILGSS